MIYSISSQVQGIPIVTLKKIANNISHNTHVPMNMGWNYFVWVWLSIKLKINNSSDRRYAIYNFLMAWGFLWNVSKARHLLLTYYLIDLHRNCNNIVSRLITVPRGISKRHRRCLLYINSLLKCHANSYQIKKRVKNFDCFYFLKLFDNKMMSSKIVY